MIFRVVANLQMMDNDFSNSADNGHQPNGLNDNDDEDYSQINKLPINERWKNLKARVKSLNRDQRRVYNRYYEWHNNNKDGVEQEPIQEIVTGGAGTGKTFLLNCLVDMINLVYFNENHPYRQYVQVMAPTGVSAHLVNGKTLHCALHLRIDAKDDGSENLQNRKLADAIRDWTHIKHVIIDELSMIGNDRMIQIDSRLGQLSPLNRGAKKPSDQFMGGLNVTLCGDPLQLNPVRALPIFRSKVGFECLWNRFNFCELEQNMRQKGDVEFQTLLNNLRIGQLSLDDIQLLMSRKATKDSFVGIFAPENTTHIYPTNDMVRKHNEKIVEEVARERKVKLQILEAVDTLSEGNLPKGVTIEEVTPDKVEGTAGIHKMIRICEGSRIMLLKNLNVQQGLTNGAFGNITKIVWPCLRRGRIENDLPEYVTIKFDHLENEINIPPRVYRFDGERGVGVIERRQVPIVLAYACTTHKLQGCTVSSAVVHLGDKIFSHGQPYVTLSRVRSLETVLITDLNFDRIKSFVNQAAVEELRKLPRDGDGRRRF